MTTTNVMLPAPQWTLALSNAFDPNGKFKYTNAIDTSVPGRVFRIMLP